MEAKENGIYLASYHHVEIWGGGRNIEVEEQKKYWYEKVKIDGGLFGYISSSSILLHELPKTYTYSEWNK